MAALSPATAGFGACVVPSSRAESVSAESASRREGALIQPRARRRELLLRGAESAEGERLAERGTRPPRGCSKAVHSFRIKILKKCMFTCFLSEVRGSTSQCFVQRVDIF